MNTISSKAVIRDGVIIGDNVIIEDNVFIDFGTIIRDNVHIKHDTKIGARCIIGEYLVDFFDDCLNKFHPLEIGANSIIRSETIIYGDTRIGDNFQTGHRVTIREKAEIGHHVRIGTLSDIQGYCKIGNYVNMHSNVFISHKSTVEDFVWIFPHVVLANDPTPPSYEITGATLKKFAVVSAGTIVLPGVTIGEDAVVGARSNVTKDVEPLTIVAGNPAKPRGLVTEVKNKFTGEQAYPWRYHFERGMPWEGIGYETWNKQRKEESK